MTTTQRRRRRAAMTLAALAGTGATLWLLLGASASAPPGTAAQGPTGATDLGTAQVMDFDITTMATGTLEARNQVELRNRLEFESALVELVPEGARVKAGDVLARLNSDQLKQQVEQQEIELERSKNDAASADAELDIQRTDSAAEIRKASVNLDLARLEYEQWLQGEVETKRQDLRVRLDEAQSEADRLSLKAEQNVELSRQGFISRDEMQKQELELRKMRAALETARLNQRVYEEFQFPKERKQKQEAIDAAGAELTKTQQRSAAQLTSRESRAVNCRREVALRQQRLDKLREQMESAIIRAPQDGLVVYGSTVEQRWWGDNNGPFQIGRKIYPNQLIIALPDVSAMNAVVKVHESIAGRVKPGQTAVVRIDAVEGKSVAGTVQKIGLLAQADNWRDPNLREYSVTINLGPQAQGLDIRPSMRCEVLLQLDRAGAALAVPVQAIFAEGSVRFVYTPARGGRDDAYVRVPVTVGRRSDRFAEVSAGLSAGARVLLRAPRPGESAPGEFTDEQLLAVGMERTPKGDIVPKEPAVAAPTAAAQPVSEAPPAPGTSPGVPTPAGG